MDRERCDAWAAAFAKLKTGLQVWDLPPEEHYALLRPGLFEGMDEVTAQEEAEWVVRYWLHGRDSFIHRSAWSSNCEELAQNRTDIRRGSGRRGDQERSLMSAELFSQAPVFSHDAWAIHSTLISWLFGEGPVPPGLLQEKTSLDPRMASSCGPRKSSGQTRW